MLLEALGFLLTLKKASSLSLKETIVASATPPGRGGISVVRISGKNSSLIGSRLCGKLPRPWSFKPCSVLGSDKSMIDSGLVVFFKSPKSYTGEDVVEIHCHGNPVVVDSIISSALSFGARVAEPGEFTKRAFLNGKIDLAQAESVADLIAAQTASAVVAANSSLSGKFSLAVGDTIKRLVKVRVQVEACFDFPDEGGSFGSHNEITGVLGLLNKEVVLLEGLLSSSRVGCQLREGACVVVVGPPNCGKSTLLNRLAGEDRAIVSSSPGTTRDPIRVGVDLGGLPVELIDTAGLRSDGFEGVEKEGMKRAVAASADANLILIMSEVGKDFCPPFDFEQKSIRVFNKTDLLPEVDFSNEKNTLYISALKGFGIDELVRVLYRELGVDSEVEAPVLARRRHLSSLEGALFCLKAAVGLLEKGSAFELVAEELLGAQKELGQITSPVSSDDLLGEIFSTFCIGK